MKQFGRTTFFAAYIALTLTSCHFNREFINREEDKKDAEIITNKLFELLKTKNYEETIILFSKKFLNVTNKEKLFEIYSATTEKLGELKEAEIQSWETRRVEGSNPSADYILVYKNKYDKFESKETIRLIREEDGKIRIVAYNINSNGFLKK